MDPLEGTGSRELNPWDHLWNCGHAKWEHTQPRVSASQGKSEEPCFFQGKQVLESSLVGEPDQSSSLGSVGIVVESREYLRALETMLSSRRPADS